MTVTTRHRATSDVIRIVAKMVTKAGHHHTGGDDHVVTKVILDTKKGGDTDEHGCAWMSTGDARVSTGEAWVAHG